MSGPLSQGAGSALEAARRGVAGGAREALAFDWGGGALLQPLMGKLTDKHGARSMMPPRLRVRTPTKVRDLPRG